MVGILSPSILFRRIGSRRDGQNNGDVKKPAWSGLFKKSAAIYFAGVFLAGFLLFFGLAVALFMVGFQVKSVNYVRFAGRH